MKIAAILALTFPLVAIAARAPATDADAVDAAGEAGITPPPELDFGEDVDEDPVDEDAEGEEDDDDDDEDEDEEDDDEDEDDEDEDEEAADYDEADEEDEEDDENVDGEDDDEEYDDDEDDEDDEDIDPNTVAVKFPDVLDESADIDDTPIEYDDDTVTKHLGKRFNTGGVYYCQKKRWGGKCHYRDGKLGECYDLDGKLNNKISSFGSDKGSFACTLYKGPHCTGEHREVNFPGQAKLSELGFNDKLSSYKCHWKGNPMPLFGTPGGLPKINKREGLHDERPHDERDSLETDASAASEDGKEGREGFFQRMGNGIAAALPHFGYFGI